MAYIIPDADALVDYLKDFTGSSDDTEIKQCIFQAELAMRNVELPALRTNPYETFGTVGANQLMPIPADMNKPILFFQQGTNNNNQGVGNTGPWIVYDRIGDRDIITQGLVAQLYLSPVNIPAVIRGKFSEVGDNYQFLPYVGAGTQLNLYYYRAWNLLFTPAILSTNIGITGDITTITGSGPWTVTITSMSGTGSTGMTAGDTIVTTPNIGNLGADNIGVISNVVSATSIIVTVAAGPTTPTAGLIDIDTLNSPTTVQTNPVLQTWPEGYIYGSLSEYYQKRHSADDAALYKAKFDMAYQTVEYQNSLGKWSGGHTRMTSIFQPRSIRSYAVK